MSLRLEKALLNGNQPDAHSSAAIRLAAGRKVEDVFPSPSASTPAETERAQTYHDDFLWLEGVGSGENTRLPSLAPTFRIRVVRVSEIFKNVSDGLYHEHDIPLPEEDETAVFLEYYTGRIDPGQHFSHVPTCT